MKKKGFALVTALILCFVLSVIGTAAITLSYISYQTSMAEKNFYLAEKAANVCLLAAVDEINRTGFCGNQEYTASGLGYQLPYGTTCKVTSTQSTNICFLRAEGQARSSRVFKTTIIQGFYGAGLYTVRGGVSASYSGGLLTGCDAANNCTVPAFIASSGTINLGSATPRYCPQTSSTGIWGNPPTYTNAAFRDLVPLFFNVNCFASDFYNPNYRCNYGLTDALRDTYGWVYRNNNQTYFTPYPNDQPSNNATDFYFSPYGEPVINPTLKSDLSSPSSITSIPCSFINNSTSYNLNNFCSDYYYPNPTCGNYTIVFTTSSTITLTGTLPSNCGGTDISSRWVTIFLPKGGTINNLNGNLPVSQTSLGEWRYRLNIYSGGPLTISNGLNFTRILTNATVNISSGITINNSTVIQVLNHETENNNANAPQNLINSRTTYFYDSKIISRHIRFVNNHFYAFRTLLYLYANACPNCVRNTSDPNQNPCYTGSNYYRCGWYGGSYNAYIGMYGNGTYLLPDRTPLTSIVINNNSIVRSSNFYIAGIYFGQDVNYLLGSVSVIRGFLVRNFPPNLSLRIGFNSNTNFQFKLDAINSLRYDPLSRRGFWFVRKVECIREKPTPAYFSIITRMTTW
ncbi:hypothetical protein F1847_07400 [Thermodesulfobacterium sp. TA1]|uniref:pilus assembly PilX N-terminal domain-containing protein n=1 Tax=Thermodesulfobacterium sp. TA1 TaxID=2234087 RepID=UPI001231C430|nr:pilus assembly PilX N-terminal domain-containing protein [Thermodesulfobacterium sp. TA1]QER42574.1 hypothetical protein F1847_07400 [Thermodesulfobacterium sp. TA1]